jgi:MFS family permease
MGWSIGIGRIGAILAPTIVGVLIDAGWKTADLYYVFSIPLIVAMLTVLAIKEG